jgi:hypothetical protein
MELAIPNILICSIPIVIHNFSFFNLTHGFTQFLLFSNHSILSRKMRFKKILFLQLLKEICHIFEIFHYFLFCVCSGFDVQGSPSSTGGCILVSHNSPGFSAEEIGYMDTTILFSPIVDIVQEFTCPVSRSVNMKKSMRTR